MQNLPAALAAAAILKKCCPPTLHFRALVPQVFPDRATLHAADPVRLMPDAPDRAAAAARDRIIKTGIRTMTLIRSNIEGYPEKVINLDIDDPDIDFAAAKNIAKQKAAEIGDDPMLLSWYNGKSGESYPNLECGPGDKPAWITYAESRGGNLTIDINHGDYVFIYLLF